MSGASESVSAPGNSAARPGGKRRWALLAAAALVAVGIGGLSGWAFATAFTPPKDVLDSSAFTFAEVTRGEIGSSITLNAVAEWTPASVGVNRAQGVVTSVLISEGEEVGAGATLYSVNLRPVVIARGDVPAFRALSTGSTGSDVAQVQTMLAELGFYGGAPDGTFGASTARAVRAWQKALGIQPDGVVQAGDLVFVPELPLRVTLDSAVIYPGATVSGGELVVGGLPTSPTFTIPVTDAQAAVMPPGTRVVITVADGKEWEAVVETQTRGEDQGSVIILLGPPEAGAICGDECDLVPVEEQALLRSQIVTLATTQGHLVPVAALLSRPDGGVVVIDEDGVEHRVSVVARARGQAVVDGVPVGLRVRVPAEEE